MGVRRAHVVRGLSTGCGRRSASEYVDEQPVRVWSVDVSESVGEWVSL